MRLRLHGTRLDAQRLVMRPTNGPPKQWTTAPRGTWKLRSPAALGSGSPARYIDLSDFPVRGYALLQFGNDVRGVLGAAGNKVVPLGLSSLENNQLLGENG